MCFKDAICLRKILLKMALDTVYGQKQEENGVEKKGERGMWVISLALTHQKLKAKVRHA